MSCGRELKGGMRLNLILNRVGTAIFATALVVMGLMSVHLLGLTSWGQAPSFEKASYSRTVKVPVCPLRVDEKGTAGHACGPETSVGVKQRFKLPGRSCLTRRLGAVGCAPKQPAAPATEGEGVLVIGEVTAPTCSVARGGVAASRRCIAPGK